MSAVDSILRLERDRESLIAALKAAMRTIQGECCSHDGPHSADNSSCYTREYHALLRGLGE